MVVGDDWNGNGRSGPDHIEQLVRADRVSGRLYLDPAIFEREMDRIHHRGWVFVAEESGHVCAMAPRAHLSLVR